MKFTPEELAEMARADAEIEAEFSLTTEELAAARERDRQVELDGMDCADRQLAERKRAYYEANREKLAERQRAYREANREKLAEYQRAYREANREKLSEYQRAYREANREKLAERKRMIAVARKACGLRQIDLARRLGVSRQLIALWETGAQAANWELLFAALPALKEERGET